MLAVTLNGPPILFAVRAGAVAVPSGPVRMGMGGEELNVPPAPPGPDVTVNITATPCRGNPLAPVTVTCNGTGNNCPVGALCPAPADIARIPKVSPLCVTVIVWPSTAICPTRLDPEEFAWNEKLIVPPDTLVI